MMITAPAATPIRMRAKRGCNTVGAVVFTSLITAPLNVVFIVADRDGVAGRSKDSLSRR